MFDYYHDRRPDFIFDHCYSKDESSGLPKKRPRTKHNQDNVQIYFECPKGAEVLLCKERQIGWTWDATCCILTDMLFETPFFTAFWQSIDDEHSCEVIRRAEFVVNQFTFPLPPEYKNFITGSWTIDIPPNDHPTLGRDEGKMCQWLAFSKKPTHITGKTPNVFVIDEACKFDPPNLYEKAKREAKAAVRTAKFFHTSTTLFGNSFEQSIKLPAVVGPGYTKFIESFQVPTHEQWLKARDDLARKAIEEANKPTKKKNK